LKALWDEFNQKGYNECVRRFLPCIALKLAMYWTTIIVLVNFKPF